MPTFVDELGANATLPYPRPPSCLGFSPCYRPTWVLALADAYALPFPNP